MSDTFHERELGMERKNELEREHAFKIRGHRNRHFGRWIAAQLGLTGTAADDYAAKFFDVSFEHPGDEAMMAKARADLKAADKSVDDKAFYDRLHEAENLGVQEVMGRAPRARPR